ncbi:MAG: ADP-ribose pyrophosphatase [Microgenomates group bacterium Gr01-1014_5]|nr:MAG: ADP-ribose pyrophosphatase [Microgenomates group bacterium Gr01-1014_5]
MDIQRPLSKQPLPKEAKRVFKGVIFDVYQWQQKMFDGSVQTFEKLKRKDTVIIIPITEEGKIILIEQEQPARNPFIGLAGGRINEGENIETAACRELLEETGYETDELVFWDAIQPVGKIEWSVFTFIAKNCRRVNEPQLDAGEKMRLKFVTFDEFVEIVTDNGFDDLEIVMKVMRAKLNSKKMEDLRKLFLS